jgi:hypothetical protein
LCRGLRAAGVALEHCDVEPAHGQPGPEPDQPEVCPRVDYQ